MTVATVDRVDAATRWRTIGAVVVPIVALDQATKAWAVATLADRSIDVLPTVELSLTYNSGFSFGTGSGLGPVVGVAVIAIIAWLAVRLAREQVMRRVVLLSAILGGALGNLVDRLFRTGGDWPLTGEVVDFVDVSWYAVFNLADAVLVLAVIAFLVTEYLHGRARRAPTADLSPNDDLPGHGS